MEEGVQPRLGISVSANHPPLLVKRRRTFCFLGGSDAKGLLELSSNLGVRCPPLLRDSMSHNLPRTNSLFSLVIAGFPVCTGISSVASVLVSPSMALDNSQPLQSASRRQATWLLSMMRDLDRLAAPGLRGSSESFVTVKLYGTSSALTFARSIGLSTFERPEGPGFPEGVPRSFRRFGGGGELKTVALWLGF
jgi:hypothetical protein